MSAQDLLYGITDGIHFSMKHFTLFYIASTKEYVTMWYSYLFILVDPVRNKKDSKISEGSSLKRCDYNRNVMNKQFECIHYINLKVGFKIMQGIH